jgi:hypothetical protein
MPNIFHQSVEDILKAATPEQRLTWNDIFLKFGERCAISQYVFTGPASAANELQTYAARKIYLPYKFVCDPAFTVATTVVDVYNENNVIYYKIMTNASYWDATAAAARYGYVTTRELDLIYFSRLVLSAALYISFIGYRITY